MRLLSFPFRLNLTGAVASVEQGSDTWVEECIAMAMLTRPGERIQVPTFGVNDPAFAGFVVGALQRHLTDFGPAITITEVQQAPAQEGLEQVTVSWRRADADWQARSA